MSKKNMWSATHDALELAHYGGSKRRMIEIEGLEFGKILRANEETLKEEGGMKYDDNFRFPIDEISNITYIEITNVPTKFKFEWSQNTHYYKYYALDNDGKVQNKYPFLYDMMKNIEAVLLNSQKPYNSTETVDIRINLKKQKTNEGYFSNIMSRWSVSGGLKMELKHVEFLFQRLIYTMIYGNGLMVVPRDCPKNKAMDDSPDSK